MKRRPFRVAFLLYASIKKPCNLDGYRAQSQIRLLDLHSTSAVRAARS